MPLNTPGREDWHDSPLFRLMRLLGVLLFAVLVAYWAIFVFYTLEKGIAGGPQTVLAWYRHVGSSYVQGGPDGSISFPRWSAARFLIQQGVLLAVTVGLWFAVGRRRGRLNCRRGGRRW